MKNSITVRSKIGTFDKTINISGDKSLSIRWALLASIAIGKSRAFNLLDSDDVKSTLKILKKLGVNIIKNNKFCEINGRGLNGFKFKKNLTLDAGNSGTLARLISGLLIRSPYHIRLKGDKSLSRRDFSRVIEPLNKFGVNFFPKNRNRLPINLKGTDFVTPINYNEYRGSAQCKSLVMLAALLSPGTTKIKAKKSRDHTEILFKKLNIPIKIRKEKNYDFIEVESSSINAFNYNIPGDISSCAFFIVLTLLSKNSKLIIKNININPTRTGIIKILNKMGAKIKFLNKRTYMGEKTADIKVSSSNKLKGINCPTSLNSSAIDEFLIIFLVAAKAKGVSTFKNLSELNQKESPRLKIGSEILKQIGIKTLVKNHSIKIFGNPSLNLKSRYKVKNFYKDHRIFMMSVIAGLVFGGEWIIHDKDSINSSFPNFLKKINEIKK